MNGEKNDLLHFFANPFFSRCNKYHCIREGSLIESVFLMSGSTSAFQKVVNIVWLQIKNIEIDEYKQKLYLNHLKICTPNFV